MAPIAVNTGKPPPCGPAVERSRPLLIRRLGRVPYYDAIRSMRRFTDTARGDTPDELWLLEHPPVFTLGQAGRRGCVHDPGAVPVVRSDRGGQVTYHGPGQLVAYLLFDLRRAKIGARRIVETLEQAVIDMLDDASVAAARREGAPGVYVEGCKIASIGLRVRAGRTLHGLSVNVDLDLSPFGRIDTCGFADLPVTRLADLAVWWSLEEAGRRFAVSLGRVLARGIEWDDGSALSGAHGLPGLRGRYRRCREEP